MKSLKLISLPIAMLFCAVSIAQEKTITVINSDKDASLKSFRQLDTIKKTEAVHIRIGRPANNNTQPLYVVDGTPMNSKEVENIKPGTIESVTILKDSVLGYSCRRTNGVVIIKTKKISTREFRKMKKKDPSLKGELYGAERSK